MPLYALGSNGSGQLGIGHEDDVSSPTKCLFFTHDSLETQDSRSQDLPEEIAVHDEPIRIVAGGNHTLILFRSGAVYAAGANKSGQCGQDPGDMSALLSFRRVRAVVDEDDDYGGQRTVERFAAISATWEASFIIDAATGHVYVFGQGTKGELGLGEGVTQADVTSPARIADFPPKDTEVVSISSSMGHTVVVLSNGDVYGWGVSRKGQLGREGVLSKIYWSPRKIGDVTFHAYQVACGREFTVVAGDAADGQFVILGSENKKWDIGAGAPRDLKGYDTVAASWHGVYVHKRDGSVVAWGRNDRGQLPPLHFPHPEKLAVGSEHVVAVIGKGRVVSFGWGEHGNCGAEIDAQGNVAGSWNELPLSSESKFLVTGVGAGCATSWVIAVRE
ncbi:hypothetical protein AJ80_01243 [Polytolypa hystricis UAMH7299]|uniref:RCC1-like domain-containing protein n=1 Tax=Polytolypa hystricis (strain UAMH7299) TaxID=1447883 RepID=A0A2B7Z2J5_POLH7|nr:hypothetical protein AJ80_01243 [Polytolypa hystricis UAMH7299]